MRPSSVQLLIFTFLLPLSHQCFSRTSEALDKVDDNNDNSDSDEGNVFRKHLVNKFRKKATPKQRKFEPPEKVYYGFKPVKVSALNSFLDSVPGNYYLGLQTI